MTSSTIWSVRSSTYSLDAPVLMALLLQAVQLGPLSHVAGDGDDLGVVVVLLQPGDDNGRIQTAGVGQDDFLDLRHVDDLLWGGEAGRPADVFPV